MAHFAGDFHASRSFERQFGFSGRTVATGIFGRDRSHQVCRSAPDIQENIPITHHTIVSRPCSDQCIRRNSPQASAETQTVQNNDAAATIAQSGMLGRIVEPKGPPEDNASMFIAA
jgi:hypothetical protein